MMPKESIANTLHYIDLGKSFINKISLYQKLRLTSGISQILKSEQIKKQQIGKRKNPKYIRESFASYIFEKVLISRIFKVIKIIENKLPT